MMINTEVYLPREDTYLLESAVKKYAKGSCLEMGTGSGYLSRIAAEKKEVKNVIAVDINEKALRYAEKNNYNKKITYLHSNLFENVKGRFDTIFFNPPYLPDHPDVKDIALDGGEKGYELPVRFLKDAKNHLKKDGQILFLFSSLTDKKIIEKTLTENRYVFEKTNETSFDFEKLYVYKLTNIESALPTISKLTFFSKGKRGLIYTGYLRKTKVAVKTKNPSSQTPGRIEIEGQNLKKTNKMGIGPKLLKAANEYVIYKFVEGVRFEEFLEKSTKKDAAKAITNIMSQLRTLDKNHLNKEEMTNPYKHILITKSKKPVLIDFERANYSDFPHNITQFCQYLASKKISAALSKKGINIDKISLFKKAKEYKKTYADKAYLQLLKLFDYAR